MTPGARIQSAIAILDEIFSVSRPADRVFDNWARTNRYAGSKDRAAIGEMVFTVLRRRAELESATGASEARLLVFALLHLIEGRGVDEISALADGGRHTPAPLSEEEKALLSRAGLPEPDAAPWVRLNYPEWLHDEFFAAFGPGLEREMGALMERAPVDLRVNTLKTTRDKAISALVEAGISSEPTPWSPWGLRLLSKGNLPGLALFREGGIEMQDEGSQLAALLTGTKPGEQVMDLCAGGGGKSLALAAMMNNQGQLYACDTDARRLSAFLPRLRRADIRNLQTVVLRPFVSDAPDPDLSEYEGKMDCVLLDAPCSGTGAWRRNPDARWRLTPDALLEYQTAQREVLARGARLVRPGGRLVYVTCSLLPSENEKQVETFLSANGAYEQVSWEAFWPEDMPRPPAADGSALRISPAGAGTDGFFVAILRRREAP